jgi:predicted AAA+ superfamily ATPase
MPPRSDEIPRHLRGTLNEGLSAFRVVVLTGARQAGKSTLAQAACRMRRGTYLTLDDPARLAAALSDPVGLLRGSPPVTIDEVQRGGDALVRAIKAHVDARPRPGSFLLTGSTRFLTVPSLSESLAGRAEILELWPFSQGELRRCRDAFAERLFGPVETLRAGGCEELSRGQAAEILCRGGFPEVQRLGAALRSRWFASYVKTVTERDVLAVSRLRQVAELPRLLRLLAARTAQEVNLQEVSRELGLARTTLLGYIAALTTLHLWYEIPAWSRNVTSKVVKHPKGHMIDVGLAAWLLGAGADALAEGRSPSLGPLLETLVAGELARQRTWSAVEHGLFHYRDRSGPEVDLVLESRDGRIAGVEVKAADSVSARDFAGLDLLRQRMGTAYAHGVVLHLGRDVLSFGDRQTALPLSALWARAPRARP